MLSLGLSLDIETKESKVSVSTTRLTISLYWSQSWDSNPSIANPCALPTFLQAVTPSTVPARTAQHEHPELVGILLHFSTPWLKVFITVKQLEMSVFSWPVMDKSHFYWILSEHRVMSAYIQHCVNTTKRIHLVFSGTFYGVFLCLLAC